MIDVAYVQKKKGEFVNETAYTMWRGCQLLGLETRFFEDTRLEDIPVITKQTLIHGYVGSVKSALKRLDVEPQPRITGWPPEELHGFYGRKFWKATMAEIRLNWAEDKHVFIKPLNEDKVFTGHLTSGQIGDLIQTAGIPDDFKLFCSEPVEFLAEYRLFVHKGIILDCRRYRGDFRRLVDLDVTAQECVKAYKSAPVAYSLDLGLVSDGRTVVVEVNDAHSLGAYGMASIPYAQMVIDRWEEMVGA
jgi:hypothetical protein